MRNLNPFQGNCVSEFDEIAKNKRGARRQLLQNISASVHSRYNDYLINRLNLHLITASVISPGQDKDALLHCYDPSTKRLNHLKASINQLQPSRWCQYCSGLAPAESYDHYLPKELFPEFSVLAINLIPCCPHCNLKKGQLFVGSPGREIINFYYDFIPQVRFLFCDIIYRNNVPTPHFYITHNSTIPGTGWTLLENHFRNLNLCDRFNEFSSEGISEAKVSLAGKTQIYARNSLLEEANDLSQTWGINYWKVALYFGLANSNQFTSSL